MPYEQVFEGSISGYDVKIILSAEGIVFFLWHPQRRRHYQTHIPYQLTGKSKEIQTIFTNLDQFYLYITHFSQDWERVSINSNGRITVQYHLRKCKNKVPPTVHIDTQILLAGHQIRNESKLQSEVGEVKKQNLLLQNKINQLIQLNSQNRKDMEELKKMLQKKQSRYNQASESQSQNEQYNEPRKRFKKNKKKYSVISGSKSGIRQLNTTINQLKKEIQAITNHVAATTPKISPPQQLSKQFVQNQDDEDCIFGKKLQITVDTNNQYLQRHFKIQGNKITKINCYGRIQLLSKETIPLMGRHYFVMYIEKCSFMLFSLGIVAQRRRNFKNSHLDKDLISYFAKTGAIWQNGDCRVGGPLIPNNVQIRVVVDTIRWTVKWYMDKKEIGSTVIGQHLRKERLVAYLQFNFENDVVYWNDRTFKCNQ